MSRTGEPKKHVFIKSFKTEKYTRKREHNAWQYDRATCKLPMDLTSVALTIVGEVSYNHQSDGNSFGLGKAIDVLTELILPVSTITSSIR